MKSPILLALPLALGIGCKDPAHERPASGGQAETSPGPATPAAPLHAGAAPAAASAPASSTSSTNPSASLDEATLCASKCLLLTRYSLAELEGGKHAELCGGAPLVAGPQCSQFDTMRNCVYAAHGYPFKTKRWIDRFAASSWYRSRADFDEKDLSPLELANVRALKERAAACLGTDRVKVSAADARLVRAWFAGRMKGKPPLPAKLFVDGQPADQKAFLEFIGPAPGAAHPDGLFVLKSYTPMGYAEGGGPGAAAFPGAPTRTIWVSTGSPPPDCVGDDESCEGFESIEMTYAGRKLVALHVTASACPFVYVANGAGELVLAGEILRNLARAELEHTQSLTLDSPTACDGPIHVRLAEEKREITFLDAVHLEVNGRTLRPTSCEDDDADHCVDDGRYRTLREGEQLDLFFEIPAGTRCGRVRLVADGFYLAQP